MGCTIARVSVALRCEQRAGPPKARSFTFSRELLGCCAGGGRVEGGGCGPLLAMGPPEVEPAALSRRATDRAEPQSCFLRSPFIGFALRSKARPGPGPVLSPLNSSEYDSTLRRV